jgi:fatty-acyl-CoA synthase
VGRAVVVLNDGCPPDGDGIIAYCRERLARFKIPKSVVFADTLPVTGAGKIDKLALQEQYGDFRF